MNAGEWTSLFPKSHVGLCFLPSYECFTAAEASCKCAASPFPIIIHHHTLLPLPFTYVLPVLPASVSYWSTYFCSYHVFSSPRSQIPSIKKQRSAAQLVYAAVGMRSTEGLEKESSCGASALLRREVRVEKGQLEGLGLTKIFKNTRRSLYLAS